MATVIRTDGTTEQVSPKNGKTFTLDELQGVVGGYIEAVDLGPDLETGNRRVLYCNEEGRLAGLPLNAEATRIANADIERDGRYLMGGTIVGNIIICTLAETGDGREEEDEEEPALAGTTQQLIDCLRELVDAERACTIAEDDWDAEEEKDDPYNGDSEERERVSNEMVEAQMRAVAAEDAARELLKKIDDGTLHREDEFLLEMVAMAEVVVENWEEGDLAGSVSSLQSWASEAKLTFAYTDEQLANAEAREGWLKEEE